MEPLAGLVVYGPLGLWALAATGAVVHLYRDNAKLRDAAATAAILAADKAVAATNAAATAFAAQAQALSAAHAQALRDQADRYDRQAGEMQQRTFAIVTTLSDKLSALADSITRNRAVR